MGVKVYEKDFKVNAQLNELTYVEVLNKVTGVMQVVNEMAADGHTVGVLRNKVMRIMPSFLALCGVDLSEDAAESKPVRKPKPKTKLQCNLKVVDDWGICPECGKKCIKVGKNTILVNYPMFCKVCKKDHVVTWRFEPQRTKKND